MVLRRRVWAFLVLIIIGIVPVPKVFVGEWLVRVVDQHGFPVAGIRVSQSWESYTYNLSGADDLFTDSQGKVIFPRRRRIAPIGYWLIKATSNVVGFGIHASFGSFGMVVVADPRLSDPGIKQKLIEDPKALELLGENCSRLGCVTGTLESQLRMP
jgi:hypothetical protein